MPFYLYNMFLVEDSERSGLNTENRFLGKLRLDISESYNLAFYINIS